MVSTWGARSNPDRALPASPEGALRVPEGALPPAGRSAFTFLGSQTPLGEGGRGIFSARGPPWRGLGGMWQGLFLPQGGGAWGFNGCLPSLGVVVVGF